MVQETINRRGVIARCETHWKEIENTSPSLWRVRWDEMEDAEELDNMKKSAEIEEPNTFGAHLRQIRRQAGLTQRELAAQVDVDYSYISKLENGQMPPPSIELIQRLEVVLKDDSRTLMNLAGKVPSNLDEMMSGNPLLSELIRLLSTRVFSDDVYRQLIQIARDASEEK